jgi:hypothetical protein
MTKVLRLALLSSALLASAFLLLSCDGLGDFGDTNEDPTQPTELEPRFLFPQVQLNTPGNWAIMNRANHRVASAAVQHMASTSFFWVGNTYDRDVGEDNTVRLWRGLWDPLVNLQQAIQFLEQKKENGEDVDPEIAQARIWRAYIYQLMTDTHGDVPFQEGAKGAIDQEFDPAFQAQENVYDSLFAELDEAVTQLDGPGDGFGSQDLLTYRGSVDQWKKFANSLRLRLAMRLVKRDPSKAQAQAEAAVSANGGVVESVEDNARNLHQSDPGRNRQNPNSWAISESEMAYPSQTLVRWLKAREDPRLTVYGAVVRDGEALDVDTTNMKGMPNGYVSDRAPDLEDHPSWTEHCRDDDGTLIGDNSECTIDDYLQTHPELLDDEEPLFHITSGQVHLLLAEANVRGWDVPGTAQSNYEEGVREAMKRLADYGPEAEISDAEITEYLNKNPFDASGTQEEKLKQINEQYWAATYLDGIEGWSNWRRSGYPELEPVPIDAEGSGPGGGLSGNDTDGEIPRRLRYDEDERRLNTEEFQDVLGRQGPNEMDTRVWWDVEQ